MWTARAGGEWLGWVGLDLVWCGVVWCGMVCFDLLCWTLSGSTWKVGGGDVDTADSTPLVTMLALEVALGLVGLACFFAVLCIFSGYVLVFDSSDCDAKTFGNTFDSLA